MPRLILADPALAGIERCRVFLAERNPEAAIRASQEIVRALRLLLTSPRIGRPVAQTELRELVIRFGGSGYVALYREDESADAIVVLAFRHQREAGYRS